MTVKKKYNLPQVVGSKKNKPTRNYTRFFIKLIGSICIGFIIAIIALQNNYTFKKFIEDSLISSWESSLGCEVECQIQSINLFFPKIVFRKLQLKSPSMRPSSSLPAHLTYCDPEHFEKLSTGFVKGRGEPDEGSRATQDNRDTWTWESSFVHVGFSWFDLFLNGVIEVYVDVANAQVKSLITDDGFAILPTIDSFLHGGSLDIPIILKSFEIKKGIVAIQDEHANYESNICLSSITKNMYGDFKTKIAFLSGDISIASKKILDNISGAIQLSFSSKSGNTYVTIESNVYVDAQFLQNNKTCFLTGKWFYDQGVFDLQSQDESFSISPIRVYFLGDTLFAEADIHSTLTDIAGFLFQGGHDVAGTCSTKFRIDYGPLGMGASGSLLVKDVSYQDIDCLSFGKFTFKKKKDDYNGVLSFVSKDGTIINGVIDFDALQKKITGKLKNETEISGSQLPYWKVLPQSANITFSYDNNALLQGNCSCCIANEQLDTNIDVISDISCQDNILSISGKINDNTYFLDIFTDPQIKLKQLIYKDAANNNLFLLGSLKEDRNKLAGSIKFPFIKSLVKDYLDYDIEGEGDLSVYGVLKKDHILCQLLFKNGSVSFKNMYNFLNDFKITAKIDPIGKNVMVKDAKITLHKGNITCKKAILRYNNLFMFDYIYAPLIFDNCFVNIKNDLFALGSGRVLFSKEKNAFPHLAGLAIIERGTLRRNIFSDEDETQQTSATPSPFSLWCQDITCDLSVMTKNPARINMPLLKSGATVDLSLKNKLLSPEMSGKIDFLSGSIAFPYKPLYISKGSIYFLPHQSEDPLVEFVAKNKISKYNIMMYITGSFDNHHISFESSPPLSEEQIIALLIAGSAQESLNVVAPALIMQQLKDSLFGPGDTNSRFGKRNYFEKILKPFRKVRIVPSFTDQTGRGGLRGAVEIDINDRFRAFVEKNFSLSEDTRFEIECLLSDDVSARAFRRENGDIGGEMEMRWKF